MDFNTLLSIVGILLALLSLFVSPGWITSIINRTILSNRHKRIASLKQDYDVRKFYGENQNAWTAALIGGVSAGLYQLALFVFWIGVYTISMIRKPEQDMILSLNGFLTYYFLFSTIGKFNSNTKVHNDVVNLERFKQETIEKLKKLGLSREEATELLEKEETAGG